MTRLIVLLAVVNLGVGCEPRATFKSELAQAAALLEEKP